MIGFAVTGDLFNLFVFMEILSLSGYALVAVGGERIAEMASFKYLIMGAVSSLLFLFAIGMLYALTGSLNMADMARRLSDGVPICRGAFAVAMLVTGMSVKAALFPLHVWLPDAHAIAPSPISAILSALVVKIGVLGMIRVYQICYAPERSTCTLSTCARVARRHLDRHGRLLRDLPRRHQDDARLLDDLEYRLHRHGSRARDQYSVIGAAVHVFNHALIKATLFLAAGALIYRTGYRTLHDLRGPDAPCRSRAPPSRSARSRSSASRPRQGSSASGTSRSARSRRSSPSSAFVLVFGALFIFVYYIRMVNALYFQKPSNDVVPLRPRTRRDHARADARPRGALSDHGRSRANPAELHRAGARFACLPPLGGWKMEVVDHQVVLPRQSLSSCAALVFATGRSAFWRRFWSLERSRPQAARRDLDVARLARGIVYSYNLVEFTPGIGLAFRADALGMFFSLSPPRCGCSRRSTPSAT